MTAPAGGGGANNPRYWEDVAVGDDLVGYELLIDQVRLAATPSVTLDAFAGHVDLEYAQAQGHPTTFMNSLPLLGLLDRLVTDWAGPSAFICRHKLDLAFPVYRGQTVAVSAVVVDRDSAVLAGFGRRPVRCSIVKLQATIRTDAVVACRGEIDAALRRYSTDSS